MKFPFGNSSDPKAKGQNEGLEAALRRSMFHSIAIHLLLLVVVGSMIFVGDWLQHKRSADYFTRIMRPEILRGSYREAQKQAVEIVGSQGSFSGIAVYDRLNRELIQIGDTSSDFLSLTISRTIPFEANHEEIAGTVAYVYDLENVLTLILLLCLISVAITMIFLRRQRTNVLHRFQKDMQGERDRTVARMINSLAHDLQAPLNLIRLSFERPSSNAASTARLGFLRIQAMIESLKKNDIDSLVNMAYQPIDLGYLTALADGLASHHGKSFVFSSVDTLQGRVDWPKLERALQNLLVNAFEAARSQVKFVVKSSEGALFFDIIDDGEGVPSEIEKRLFQRGTTSGKTGGTGLGLAYAQFIVRAHGGNLVYQHDKGQTMFAAKIDAMGIKQNPGGMSKSFADPVPVGREFGIFLGIRDRSELDKTMNALRSIADLSVYVDPSQAFRCQLAYVSDLEQLDEISGGDWQVLFAHKATTLDQLVAKVESLVRLSRGSADGMA